MHALPFPPISLHAWLRFDAISRLLPPDVETVLEIGAGLGSAGAILARRYRYVGLEPDRTAFDVARTRVGAGTVLNVATEEYDAPEPFDLVCAFEVLEHIEDDRAALAAWIPFARAGGWLLLSVPAGSHRFGPTDIKAGHYRRYDRSDLVGVLDDTGLADIEVVAYGFPLGYALEAGRNAYARRRTADATLDERTAASGCWLQPRDWMALPMYVASAPFRYLQRPFGQTGLGTGFVARARVAA